MFCPKCGASLEQDARFCTQCGTQVKLEAAPPPTASQPTASQPIIMATQNRSCCKNCGSPRPALPLLQILLLVGSPVGAYVLASLVGMLVGITTENAFATMFAVSVPWIACFVYLIVSLNKIMNTPCYNCSSTPTEVTLNRRHSRQTAADRLAEKVLFAVDPVYTLRMGGRSFMERMASATKWKNIIPYISLVCLGAAFIPLFAEIQLEVLVADETWRTQTFSSLEIYMNFSIALTCALLIGYVAFIVAIILNLLSQSRGNGIARPIAWGGFVCHLIATLFMTESLIRNDMVSRIGELGLFDLLEISVSCPMGGVKVALLAIDVLCLILLHLSYQYDKTVWLLRARISRQSSTHTS